MIVYLEIPFGAGPVSNAVFQMFRSKLGADAVGWVGRNIRLADLASGTGLKGYRILGVPAPLATVESLADVSLWTVLVPNPLLRMAARWACAETDPDDTLHPLSHTFSLKEAIEIGHTAALGMSEVVARHLQLSMAPATVDGIVSGLETRPVLIGFGQHPVAYASALDEALGLEPGTLDHRVFVQPPAGVRQNELRNALQRTPARDLRLVEALYALRDDTKVARLGSAARKAA